MLLMWLLLNLKSKILISRNSIKFFSFVIVRFVRCFCLHFYKRERERNFFINLAIHTHTHTQLTITIPSQYFAPSALLNFGPQSYLVLDVPVDLLVLIWHTEWSVFYYRKLISNTSQHISILMIGYSLLLLIHFITFFFKLFIKLYDIYIYIYI